MLDNDFFHKQMTQPDLISSAPPLQRLPEKIGPYKIESLLNRGGMSYLYLGLHPDTGQPIVIKILSPKHVSNKEITARFLKEAHIIEMTDHPNIVKLYGQGTWEKGLYIAMEFIRGVSLRQFIQQKSLSQRRALEIILQVAYALCHLHSHRVIHRDLKPENILITENGDIKVIDFGIAQLQGESSEKFHSRRIIGTPVYMSPEQKINSEAVTYASDIYSLGIIAYELLLGRLSHGTIHLSLLPQSLRPLIAKALEPDLSKRYQDIVDFITDISHYLKTMKRQPETLQEEMSDEVLDMIQQTRQILIPQKPPRWPPVEIGVAFAEQQPLNGLYLDFFRLPENRLCIIFAEPLDTGVSSLLHSSVLRGMVRMAIQHCLLNGKKDIHPIKMLSELSQALSIDPMQQKFKLSLLLLNPDKDLLSFVSCEFANLWHIDGGSRNIRSLSTPNPLLGVSPSISLLETADNWHTGDILILRAGVKEPEPITEIGAETLLLSAQHQAERLVEKNASAVLAIHRIF